MRIAMLTNNYKPFIGGVPISIERLADGLRSLGHEVYIVAPKYEQEEEDPYVIRIRPRKKKLKGEFIVPDILDPVIENLFSNLEFDLIHVHHPMLIGYTATRFGKKYNIPVVFTYHTRYEQYLHYLKPYEILQNHCNKSNRTVFHSLEKKILYQGSEKLVALHNRLFMNKCNLVFAPTPSMKQFLEEHGTITNVEIMPTGLIEDDFGYEPSKVKEIRNTYGRGKSYLFCSVSRLEKEKNISFILEGMKLFKERRGNCFRLLLIGEGTKRIELQDQTAKLGLTDNIVFCGCIPHKDIRNYYQASDLFLFSSQSETQGIVLLEAMAAGLPVVAVEASGVRDVVKDTVNGFMTDNNMSIWEYKIEQILFNPLIKEKMQQEAKKEAKRYLSANVARIAERSYQNVLIYHRTERVYANKII